jgi:hypothetical protein
MYKNIKEFTQSKSFQGILIGILISIVVLLIFQAGVMVGQHKAGFGDRMGEHFERNFVDMERYENLPPPMAFGFGEMLPPGGHGAAGQVISVALPTFVIAGPDNLERTVVVNDETVIRQFRDEVNKENIETGRFVVVLGEPNDKGEIEAKLIRFLPPPPDFINNESITTE